MSAGAVLASRVTAEIGMLMSSPPPGVSCWPVGDSIVEFEAGTSCNSLCSGTDALLTFQQSLLELRIPHTIRESSKCTSLCLQGTIHSKNF